MRIVEESRSKPPGRENKIEWNAVFAKAEGILQTPQLAILRGIQARERAGRAVNSETAVEAPASAVSGSAGVPPK